MWTGKEFHNFGPKQRNIYPHTFSLKKEFQGGWYQPRISVLHVQEYASKPNPANIWEMFHEQIRFREPAKQKVTIVQPGKD